MASPLPQEPLPSGQMSSKPPFLLLLLAIVGLSVFLIWLVVTQICPQEPWLCDLFRSVEGSAATEGVSAAATRRTGR